MEPQAVHGRIHGGAWPREAHMVDGKASGRIGVQRRGIGVDAGGREVSEYLLDAGTGVRLAVLDLGGIVTALDCPDRHGRIGNVVMGPAQPSEYLGSARNFNSLVGRYAGRIAGGRIVESWAEYDALGLLQQLGAIPAPTQAPA